MLILKGKAIQRLKTTVQQPNKQKKECHKQHRISNGFPAAVCGAFCFGLFGFCGYRLQECGAEEDHGFCFVLVKSEVNRTV
jgi:hypothetical protein